MIPDYWLERPEVSLAEETLEAFEANFKGWKQGVIHSLDNNIPVPKWQFLIWLVENKNVLLHGSANPAIELFEPRAPNDRSADDFSKQKAVFAVSDGIWPIFYAVVDRQNYTLRMLNSTLQFQLPEGLSEMHYFFSITKPAFEQYPFRQGTVYVLPKASFQQQPLSRLGNGLVLEPQWASPKEVQPLAKLTVTPEDFPFLKQIKSHNEYDIEQKSAADPYGFPWLAEEKNRS